MTVNTPPPAQGTPAPEKDVYILITQCLQNNFFLANENRLCLPPTMVSQMLLGTGGNLPDPAFALKGNQRVYEQASVKKGPLFQYFQAVLGDKERTNDVHVINIKDWHKPGVDYDRERRRYGSHCEAGMWEAEGIDGFDSFLEPWGKNETEREIARKVDGLRKGKNIFYEVLSDSLFDFKPREDAAAHDVPLLKAVMDKLIHQAHERKGRVYMVVIGVYSDIKMMTLLTTLRGLYDIDNLIVSDVLSASSTLERHLSGLDYMDKVLEAEIVHSLNDLADVLHETYKNQINPDIIRENPDFRQYRSYYLDKQNVLSYQDHKLNQYLDLTSQRAADVYKQVFNTNRNLTFVGYGMLLVTLVTGFLRFLDPVRFPMDVVLILGGISLSQLLVGFFYNPLKNLQHNLNNLVRLRNYLETYSTITALLRHHFTAPEYLNDKLRQTDTEEALKRFEHQMEIVRKIAEGMAGNFKDISQQDMEDLARTKELLDGKPPA